MNYHFSAHCLLTPFPLLRILLSGYCLFAFFIASEAQVKSSSSLVTTTIDFDCTETGPVNLVIHNAFKDWATGALFGGPASGQPVASENEESVGAITVANKNDTDGDSIQDNSPTETNVVASSVGRNEIDLMKLVLKKPAPSNGGSTKLTIVSGNIKLWTKPTKGIQLNPNANGAIFFPVSKDTTIYVEAVEPSDSVRDIVLKLTYQGNEDVVRATAVWVDRTNVWRVRQQANGLPENPVPLTVDLPNLNQVTLVNNIIPGRRSVDGSRYGHGLQEQIAGSDNRIGGRILFEFRISPPGSDSLGITFDITRQKKVRKYEMGSGSGALPLVTNNQNDLFFPWEETSPMDNEIPDDDDGPSDEDNEPTNNFIYSWDAPSLKRQWNPHRAFIVERVTFKEYVRIMIGNTVFTNSNASPQGSRASEKTDWHCVYYTRLGANGKLEADDPNNLASSSAPIKSATGNGTVSVSLEQGIVNTRGYSLDYNSFTGKWTLKEAPTNMTVLSGNISANTWTMTLNGVTATITQGSTPFQNGDKFTFSVFKTQSVGKLNVTDLGFFDVTGNP